jgi:predicted nicotinamide N-methyase
MQYHTERLSLNFDNLSIQIERVTNIDELYAALVAKGENHEDFKDERIPYWAELWASALALSQYIVANKVFFEKKNIIEIGAGLALPSIIAGHFTAQITITDYLSEAVDFAKKNWYLTHRHDATFQLLDWRQPSANQQYDIVLAADIAYEKRMFEHLPQAFHTLCKPKGTIFLTEPNRGFAQDFLKNLTQNGFEIEKNTIPITLWGITTPVNLLKINRTAIF